MERLSSKQCIESLKAIIKRIEEGELQPTFGMVILEQRNEKFNAFFSEKYKVIPFIPTSSIEAIGILAHSQAIISHGYWDK